MKELVVLVALAFLVAVNAEAITSPINPQDNHEATVAYWTLERQQAAIPMDHAGPGDLPYPDDDFFSFPNSAAPRAAAFDSSDESGESGMGEGYNPNPASSEEAAADGAFESHNLTKRDQGYPFEFTAAYAPAYNYFPWSAIGKIFVTIGGVDYQCSGAVQRPYLVVTAGHCVYGVDVGWATSFLFIPGYPTEPFGAFSWYTLTTSTYFSNPDTQTPCRDFGFAVLWPNAGGPVGNQAGYFGYMYGASTELTWTTLGYAPGSTVNYYTTSPIGFLYNFCQPGGSTCGNCNTNLIGVGRNDQDSGGPWIYNWGSSYYYNGLNAWKWNQYWPAATFSPYLDSYWYNMMASCAAIVP